MSRQVGFGKRTGRRCHGQEWIRCRQCWISSGGSQRSSTKLLIVPVPAKVGIYPERLGKNIKVEPQAAFLQRLQEAGLNVLDLEPVFAEHRKDPANRPLYLAQDSHWSPEGCRVAAEAISRRMQFCARNSSTRIRMVPNQGMEIRGDLARMAGDTGLPKEMGHA